MATHSKFRRNRSRPVRCDSWRTWGAFGDSSRTWVGPGGRCWASTLYGADAFRTRRDSRTRCTRRSGSARLVLIHRTGRWQINNNALHSAAASHATRTARSHNEQWAPATASSERSGEREPSLDTKQSRTHPKRTESAGDVRQERRSLITAGSRVRRHRQIRSGLIWCYCVFPDTVELGARRKWFTLHNLPPSMQTPSKSKIILAQLFLIYIIFFSF